VLTGWPSSRSCRSRSLVLEGSRPPLASRNLKPADDPNSDEERQSHLSIRGPRIQARRGCLPGGQSDPSPDGSTLHGAHGEGPGGDGPGLSSKRFLAWPPPGRGAGTPPGRGNRRRPGASGWCDLDLGEEGERDAG